MQRTSKSKPGRRDMTEWTVKILGKVVTFGMFVVLVLAEAIEFIRPVRLEIYLLLIAIFLGATNTVNVVVDRILGR